MELHEHPLLSHLTREQADTFAGIAEQEQYGIGESIVREGDLGDAMFIVLSGEAEVVKTPPKPGEKNVRLAMIGPGEFFGEMSMVEPAPRSATVRALAACDVCRLSNTALTRAMEQDPTLMNSVLVGIIKGMSEKLRITSNLVVQLKRNLDALANVPTAI